MAPRKVTLVLDEMLAAIDGIQAAILGKTFQQFQQDWLLRHGVQRGLEIISEASRHIPDPLLAEAPDIPWNQVRAIGNLLRHEYHRIADAIVWNAVVDELDPLRKAVIAMRATLDE